MIHIYCDGGLGNRLLMMFSGLYFSKVTNKKFIIHWPLNNWCGCNFNDLFDNKYNITNFNLKFVDENSISNQCTLLIHELQIPFKPNKIYINSGLSKEIMVKLFATEKNILYYGNSLHSSLTPDDIIPVINDLKITGDVLSKISKYNTEGYFGVHVRGTDFPEKAFITPEDLELEIGTHPEQKYFICSDQKDIEQRLTRFNNTLSFEKTNYVETLDKAQGWHGWIKDDLDRSFNFNVNRNKTSVIEAFCDMLLLSKTKLLKTSNSSFLKCAHALSKGKII